MDSGGGASGLFATEQASLRDELQAWLAWGADAGVLLAAPGKLLASTPSASTRVPAGFWALLPLSVASYCSDSPREDGPRIRRLAVACELLLCALDYYDEIEDNDASRARRQLGDGRLLNCASALYQEGLLALAELDDTSRLSTPSARLSSIASEELRRAMSGQHLDLLAEQRPLDGFDSAECIAIAQAKSGTLCRMACRLATALVGAPGEVTALLAEIGTHTGIASQIENDIHDLEQTVTAAGTAPLEKSDLARSKKTFPLVLLARSALQTPVSSADTLVYEGQEQKLAVYRNVMQQALGGAIVHRLAAGSLAERLEQLRGAAAPRKLRAILGLDA